MDALESVYNASLAVTEAEKTGTDLSARRIEFKQAIIKAHDDGYKPRTIANSAGLSRQRVYYILKESE